MRGLVLLGVFALVACDRPDAPPTPRTDAGEVPPVAAEPAPEPAPVLEDPAPQPVPPTNEEPDHASAELAPSPDAKQEADTISSAPKAAPAAPEGCRADADCEAGSVCVGEGLAGCGGAPGRCEASAKCTRDAKPYCGCDGNTFRASSRCPGREYAYAGECRSEKAAAGQPCLASVDCASGICEGQGCGPNEPGTCIRKNRTCTTDAVVYCGCDGKTFRSSSQCPGRRYRNRGECKQ